MEEKEEKEERKEKQQTESGEGRSDKTKDKYRRIEDKG